MKNTKKIILGIVALFLTSSVAFQASNNSAAANAEYRNTRKLFAALGLKHTNDLVIEAPEVQLMEASKDAALAIAFDAMRDVTASKRLSVNEFKAMRQVIKEQPIRKDLKVKFINEKIGYGVFATNNMPVNTVIGVYAGKVNSDKDTNQDYSFPFIGIIVQDPLSGREVDLYQSHNIDASIYGNATRFINHSSDCNCNTLTILDENKIPQVIFVTRDPIAKGQEITINYGGVYNWDKKAVKPKAIISK